MRLLRFIAIGILLTSCAAHIGNMSSNAVFADGNSRIMNIATGTAETMQVFGISGLKREALVLDAKKNLYANYPLSDGQVYGNLTIDYKRTFLIVVVKTKVTISADIVQFNPTDEQKKNDLFRSNQLDSIETEVVNIEKEGEFAEGQSVGVLRNDDLLKMKVKEPSGKKRFVLMAADSSEFIFMAKDIFILKGETNYSHGYNIGDKVVFKKNSDEGLSVVMGINKSSALLFKEKRYQIVETEEIIYPEDLEPEK